MPPRERLAEAAETVINRCMCVRKDEMVLIVTDAPLSDLGRILFQEAEKVTRNAVLAEITPLPSHGSEPPAHITAAMAASDVVLVPASRSISHTKARKEATAAGARVATLPGITAEIMARSLTADYEAIAIRTRKLTEVLAAGQTVQISTEAGTDLELSIAGQRSTADNGLYGEPGSFGNLPAGEAFIAPVEGTTTGLLIIDGAMAGIGTLTESIRIEIEDGYAVSIEGGREAAQLEELIAPYGKDARNIAELGIGTNHQARLTGNVLEDEKVMGTIHIALGDNSNFGGNTSVESHLDGIITRPTVSIDGRVIIEDGSICML